MIDSKDLTLLDGVPLIFPADDKPLQPYEEMAFTLDAATKSCLIEFDYGTPLGFVDSKTQVIANQFYKVTAVKRIQMTNTGSAAVAKAVFTKPVGGL